MPPQLFRGAMDKLKALARRLWTLYRITPEEQRKIEEFQKRDPEFSLLLGNRMGTDHDHATGLIRGRLDWRINKAYGLLEKARPQNLARVLRALARYHDSPPAVRVIGPRFGLIGLAKSKKQMVYGPPEGFQHEPVQSTAKHSHFAVDEGLEN